MTSSTANCEVDQDECCKRVCSNSVYYYGSLKTTTSSPITYYCDYSDDNGDIQACPSWDILNVLFVRFRMKYEC